MMNASLDITPVISVVSIILEVTAAHAKWALLSVKITTHVQVRGISFKGIRELRERVERELVNF